MNIKKIQIRYIHIVIIHNNTYQFRQISALDEKIRENNTNDNIIISANENKIMKPKKIWFPNTYVASIDKKTVIESKSSDRM